MVLSLQMTAAKWRPRNRTTKTLRCSWLKWKDWLQKKETSTKVLKDLEPEAAARELVRLLREEAKII